MASQNFVDYVKICCRSGKGGQGSTHMHRDKTTSKGGPDGGDGGRGGHVIIRGNSQLWTLLHLKYQRHVIAAHGEAGSGNRRHGGDGKDAIIEVPLGTLVKDAETGEVQAEITEHGQEIIATPGGRGGQTPARVVARCVLERRGHRHGPSGAPPEDDPPQDGRRREYHQRAAVRGLR